MKWTYREPDAPGKDLLLGAVLPDRSEEVFVRVARVYRQLGDARVLSIAQDNKVVHLVAHLLLSSGIPIEPHWKKRLEINQGRAERLFHACRRACRALEAAGCRPVVIEGASTYLTAGLPLATYEAGDVDVLVDPRTWRLVPEVLADAGFRRERRPGSTTSRMEFSFSESALGDTRQGDARPCWIEVTSVALERSRGPLRYSDQTQAWLERRACIEGSELWTLAPSDAVVMAAMHASLHYYVRSPALRLFLDIDRAVRQPGVDWAQVAAGIEAGGAVRRCVTSLVVARALLGSPVPDAVLERDSFSAERWRGVRLLLESEGVLARGAGAKLSLPKALVLDGLVTDEPLRGWVWAVVREVGRLALGRRGALRGNDGAEP